MFSFLDDVFCYEKTENGLTIIFRKLIIDTEYIIR